MHTTPLAPTDHRSSISVPDLRGRFNGPVLAPGDPGYDQARALFYGGFEELQPAAIIRPADAAEVARIVTLARDSRLELAVRGGGHSNAGHSTTDGGIVLDLANLKGLEIDLEQRTAWAEAGLTAGEYTVAAGAHGLATGFGDTGSVGIGGITLGGGIGFLVRKHGLTIDHLLAAELVTADGQLRHLDAGSHPELFWAIRGGGGNFGVATRFRFRLHELPSIVGGMLLLPADDPGVIEGFMAAAAAAPEELSAIANIMVAPPMPFIPAEAHGKLILMALVAWAGDSEAGERALAPFRALAEPLADMLRPMPYAGLFEPVEDMEVTEESARSLFMDTVDAAAAATIVERLQASTAPMAVAQLRALGGAMARVPADATAFAHRDRRVMGGVGAVYDRAADKPVHDAWADGFAAALRQGEPGVYVDFLADEGPGRVREAYPGATWDQLAEVKRRWDPANLFHHNQNIRPSAPAFPQGVRS
jgi:FAD/FMN-containing dehydrogenase